MASSGIAATLLEGGRTAHFALKLALNKQINDTSLQHRQKQRNGENSTAMQIDCLGRIHDGPQEVTGGTSQNANLPPPPLLKGPSASVLKLCVQVHLPR